MNARNIKMSEKISHTHYEPKQFETRREVYADGSVNEVADKVGDSIDLSDAGHKWFNLNHGSILDITTENFDDTRQELIRTDYIIVEGGYGPGVILQSVKGRPGVRTQITPEYNQEWIDALRDKPLTIGSRPSLLGGEKLKSISSAMPGGFGGDSAGTTTANPISIAIRIMGEQNDTSK